VAGKVLLKINGSRFLTNSWKQQLVITEDAVEGETLVIGNRVKMRLPFDRIAQVNVYRHWFTADVEVVNAGGTDNLVIRAVSKRAAEQARQLIDERMRAAKAVIPSSPASVADELTKLATLREQGHLTEAEFTVQKQRLLGAPEAH
jgi:hypothetical protein